MAGHQSAIAIVVLEIWTEHYDYDYEHVVLDSIQRKCTKPLLTNCLWHHVLLMEIWNGHYCVMMRKEIWNGIEQHVVVHVVMMEIWTGRVNVNGTRGGRAMSWGWVTRVMSWVTTWRYWRYY